MEYQPRGSYKTSYHQEGGPTGAFTKVRNFLYSRLVDIHLALKPVRITLFEEFEYFPKIAKAYSFAVEGFNGKRRKDGSLAKGHIARSDDIRRRAGIKDLETALTLMLHDSLEELLDDLHQNNKGDLLETDRSLYLWKMEGRFGRNVASSVEVLTPPIPGEYTDTENKDDLTFKCIRDYADYNPRALLVKLIERLDNMRTLGSFSEERRYEYSIDTLRYIELGRRLLPQLAQYGEGKQAGLRRLVGMRSLDPETAILKYVIEPNEQIADRIIERRKKREGEKGLEEVIKPTRVTGIAATLR